MVDVFLLLVFLGVGEDRRMESNNMHFRDLNECNYFASQISKRYGTYGSKGAIDRRDKVIAYCVPRQVNPERTKVY